MSKNIGEDDYVVLNTHESRIGGQSNYTYKVEEIHISKEAAESAIRNSSDYKWAGNSTGSVAYSAVKRTEVPDGTRW